MRGKVFYSLLMTEINSFSDLPTTLGDFTAGDFFTGEDVIFDGGKPRPGLKTIFEAADRWDCDLVGGLHADAPVGGPVEQADYEYLRNIILRKLEQALPVKAVILYLHGAMIATECYDCEGDLLGHIRDLVGPDVPIGAVLDPHAHLSPAMVEAADILIFMKEYPHIDGGERMQELIRIIDGMLKDEVKPIPYVQDCQMIGFFPTQDPPMSDFVQCMQDMEQTEDILSISFVHGFPWGDTPFTGAKMLAYGNHHDASAEKCAKTLAQKLWAIKEQVMPPFISIDEMITKVSQLQHTPLVIADQADNPGGGGPSDSTFILQALIDQGLSNIAIGLIYDPQAVRKCHESPLGAEIKLSIGGKSGVISGNPVEGVFTLKNIQKDARMKITDDVDFPMGDTAWVEIAGIDIVLCTRRIQMYAPDGFEHLGINPKDKTALVVKSSNHFAAFFKDIMADYVYVNTPGAIDMNFAEIPYKIFDKSFYPKNIKKEPSW